MCLLGRETLDLEDLDPDPVAPLSTLSGVPRSVSGVARRNRRLHVIRGFRWWSGLRVCAFMLSISQHVRFCLALASNCVSA